jgi:thiaminase
MTPTKDEIFEDVIETCGEILAIIEDKSYPSTATALVVCMVIMAQDADRLKEELIALFTKEVHKSWVLFTRKRVEAAIQQLRKRRAH